MNDVFKEQLIARKPRAQDTFYKVGAIIASVILVFAAMIYLSALASLIVPIVLVAVCFGCYVLFSFLKVEYEYILTNGELDIDCIYGKSRRRRVFSGELKSVEIMCHVSDKGYEPEFSSAEVTKDCSSGDVSDNTYMFLTSYKAKKMKIIFEPNDEMLKDIIPYVGQRKFIKKK